MGFPEVTVSGTSFLRSGTRFQIKGVGYIGDNSGSNAVDVLADSQAEQCKIDASLMKDLGANVISVQFIDSYQNHDRCMQAFADNDIYVIAKLATHEDDGSESMNTKISSNIENPTWNMEVFEQYAAIYNSMAIYENLMGFNLGDGVFKDWSQLAVAPNLKAAARDMKAYAAARQYRNIPIGYFAESMEASLGSLVEYLSCGDNSSEAIDFYAIKDSSFSLCAELISSSDYSLLASDLQNVSIPIIYSQDGCLANEPLNFSEQHVIFGSNFSSIISGTIIEHWREQDGEEGYGLVNYTTTGAASTPTTLKDYKNLKSQWDEVTWNSDPPSVITPPSCPSSSSGIWPINADATLPTITDLHFATIGKSVTATGTSISSSISTGSSSASNGGSGLSNGEKAGIGVGAACGAIFFLSLAFWFIHRRRQTSQGAPPAYAPVTELHGTAVADELPDNSRGEMPDNSKKELPGTSISHELSAVPIYEAGDGIRETGPG